MSSSKHPLRCTVLADGTLIPGCYGALGGDCNCSNLEAEVVRLQVELRMVRRQAGYANTRVKRLRNANLKLRASVRRLSRNDCELIDVRNLFRLPLP